jgi:outer membrane protein OmpA-like peptidoglycan-associated protein
MSEINITRRMGGKIQNLLSGEKHNVKVKTKYEVFMVEMEDVNFHHDSAVLLPDYGTSKPVEGASEEQDRITGLAVLYACYKHVRAHPQQSSLVVGHTDRSGSRAYNQTLSELRARNVYAALTGDRTDWVRICEKKHKVEDYQQILIWLTYSLGWNCDPGIKDNIAGSKTKQAVRDFQSQYNERFHANIPVTGQVGTQTWGAFFDVYEDDLQRLLGTDKEGLRESRSLLKFTKCEAIGCGEDYPITEDRKENYRSPVDRRVEILFFDAGEEPQLDCKSPHGACTELYGKKMYKFKPLPADPGVVPAGILVVCLKFQFKDPDDVERSFPEGLPVRIHFRGGQREDHLLESGGMLAFNARKVDFTVSFPLSESGYVSISPDAGPDETDLVTDENLPELHDAGHRLFRLPHDTPGRPPWNLQTSDWDVVGTGHFKDGYFVNLTEEEKLGSEGSPVRLVLNPHWQFIRFEFFDRRFGGTHHNHKRINIPPLFIEGSESNRIESRCNWLKNADNQFEASQCLPWIIQRDGNGNDRKLPSNDIELRFETNPNTYVISNDENARIMEIVTDDSVLRPGPDRLKYYDLPVLWRSTGYFCRVNETGTHGIFDTLSADQIAASRNYENRLIISLDDIILTDENRRPVQLTDGDRVIVFYHKFSAPAPAIENVEISAQGVYRPGNDASQPYFPYSDVERPAPHHITDYPNWPRLVMAQGNFFDVFDQRTSGEAAVVGARAAVRWRDCVAAGVQPGTNQNNRPPLTNHNFFHVQPFFAQADHPARGRDMAQGVYREWESQVTPFPGWLVGRYDMVLLRCCDVDAGKEIAINLQAHRFHHNVSGMPADFDREDFLTKTLLNIPRRWNDLDEIVTGDPPSTVTMNPGDFEIIPVEDNVNIRTRSRWIAQEVPLNRAHFRIDVQPEVRSFMGSFDGTGGAGLGDEEPNQSGGFIAAHECGHAGSLPDEYNERWSNRACSYEFPGFSCNVPGDPYSLVRGPMMMEGTRDIHGRYFWHAAEWLRIITSTQMQVRATHNGRVHNYRLRNHPVAPSRNFTYYPLVMESNGTHGTRGHFDLYFFELGDDPYRHLLRSGREFNGIFLTLVKIRFALPDATAHRHIVRTLQEIQLKIEQELNFKFIIRDIAIAGLNLSRSLFYVAPRFLVETLVVDGTEANNRYLRGLGYQQPFATNATQESYSTHVNSIDNINRSPRHFLVNVRQSHASSQWGTGATLRNLRLQGNVTTAGGRSAIARAFWPFFGDMLGLNLHGSDPGDDEVTAEDIQNILVRRILPDATVSEM